MFILLAACSRLPTPVDQTEGRNEDPHPQSMEVGSAERSGRIVLTKYWWDGDRDGYGAPGTSLWATERPWRYVPLGGDCADRDAAINPGATEVADGRDNDCDGTIDEVAADTSTDTSAGDTASTDTSVTVSGILVSRDASGGLTYPATIWAWYGSGGSASANVSTSTDTLVFFPSTTDLSDHSWVDIQAAWSDGANWSDDCTGFSVTSADYTVALYENTVSTGTSDTCRVYVGLAVPYGDDVGVWTLVP